MSVPTPRIVKVSKILILFVPKTGIFPDKTPYLPIFIFLGNLKVIIRKQ